MDCLFYEFNSANHYLSIKIVYTQYLLVFNTQNKQDMKEHDQGRYVFDLPENLQSKMMSQLAIKRGVKQPHKFYGYKIGHLPDPTKLSKWSIQDPESEKLLAEAVFQEKDSSVCFREKSIQVFFQRQYSIKDLQHAVHNFTVDSKNHASLYIQRAKSITNIFAEKFNKSKEYAYGCCLAIALYTGIKSKEVYESERVSRVGNQAIKLHAADQISKIEDSQIFRHYMCIGQWLINALNSIGLHWGKVTRCVDLREDEYQMYNPGNIITWLQFSSSSVGKPSEYFADRNTRFIIYSISGRCIKDFSEYKEEETEVLFKPFSHFMVYKKQTIVEGGYQKTIFYMRQVFLGQSHRNLLWVDDFIFDPTWQNKQLMQTALYRQPFLNIIPKVNTQCAMAFLKSELGKNRSKADFRIITDMNRYNQQPYHNAGARFVKETKALKIPNDIMIFTSSIGTAVNNLKALGIDPSNVKITVSASEAVKFLTFK